MYASYHNLVDYHKGRPGAASCFMAAATPLSGGAAATGGTATTTAAADTKKPQLSNISTIHVPTPKLYYRLLPN